MNIYIGLDKYHRVLYIWIMKKIVFSQKPKSNTYKVSTTKGELISFVADQFRRLTKKNLKIPIQLYHL